MGKKRKTRSDGVSGIAEEELKRAQAEFPTMTSQEKPKPSPRESRLSKKAQKQAEKTAHNAHEEPYSKKTLVLLDRQAAYLTQLKAQIQLETGSALGASAVVRALIEALHQSGVDVSRVESEEELGDLLTKRMGD